MSEHVDTLMGIILPFTNFFIFLGLAVYFFRKPARAAAVKRRATYEQLVADARRAKMAAEEKLAKLEQREAALDQELAELRQIATSTAQLEADKILGEAERLAKHLENEAQRIAAAEVLKARGELRQEIVDAVHASVTQKLQSNLNPDVQHRLVQKKIGELQLLSVDH